MTKDTDVEITIEDNGDKSHDTAHSQRLYCT